MRVTLNWLREFAPIEGDAASVAGQLTDLGLEVGTIEAVGGAVDGVVVARVLEVREHPDADRVRLVDVDLGDGEALQIVCGASNMVEGDLVPLATVGTLMPGGMEIAARRMRGEMSNGMLCSAKELGLGDDHSGILVLGGAGESAPRPGTTLGAALDLRPDVVFDIEVNPNRPDALSVAGVARDLAARQGVPFELPVPAPASTGRELAGTVDVRIEAPEVCGRFAVRGFSGVRVGASPRWMAQRLLSAGMRPINIVVDVSNYVMLELGQPTHAFDLAKVSGPAFRVRRARAGEELETLDGVTRRLDAGDGVIADGDDRAIALAGVMGGASTEISDDTTDVLLEAAWWDPQYIADTSARHNLHSEASARFKRGVDPEVADLALGRFAQLLSEGGAGSLRPGEVVTEGRLPERVTVRVRPTRVNAVLGTDIDVASMVDLLDPIGFTSEPDAEDLLVSIPTWRPDSSVEIDVVEEVGRMYGLSRIVRTVPVSAHPGGLDRAQRARRSVRRALLGCGIDEAMPMPFLAPGDLERCGLPATGLMLANPLAAEESVLRASLRPGLLGAVAHNASHRITGVRLSEIGRVFELGQGAVVDVESSVRLGRVLDGEREQLAVALAGSEAPAAVAVLEVVLAALGVGPLVLRSEELDGMHPARAAVIEVAGADVGAVGEIDPVVLDRFGIEERVAWLELELGHLLDLPVPIPRARSVSRFPSTDIDLAFVVPDRVPAEAVRTTIRATGAPLLRELALFDVFRSDAVGADRRSLAFRIRFQADDRTLTDAEVGVIRQAIVDAVSATHDASLRA